jgi:hypothetical protein
LGARAFFFGDGANFIGDSADFIGDGADSTRRAARRRERAEHFFRVVSITRLYQRPASGQANSL